MTVGAPLQVRPMYLDTVAEPVQQLLFEQATMKELLLAGIGIHAFGTKSKMLESLVLALQALEVGVEMRRAKAEPGKTLGGDDEHHCCPTVGFEQEEAELHCELLPCMYLEKTKKRSST